MNPKTSRQKQLKQVSFICIVIVFGICLSGCTVSRISARGNLPDPERVADLKPGKTSKNTILDSLGSPSSVNTFGKETWYYISETTETTAFFRPEVLERKILIVEFDKKSVMTQIVSLGLDAGRDLTHVVRITPTFGKELTVLDQIFSNFRRFASEKRSSEAGRN